ncbi:hypothetical protein BBJ28_00003067 [Nothophytophthora sp. Chile5]|nr:hypothetical protein BBJ28_00003067 [Nothophytophthora sp. Chile5]
MIVSVELSGSSFRRLFEYFNAFLEGNDIEAVISLGTGNLAPKVRNICSHLFVSIDWCGCLWGKIEFGGLTGVLYLQRCAVLLVDILDMEEELLLPHFGRCIAFLQEHLAPTKQREQARPAAALVHCVYGQSRSAAICVAFLMATQRLAMLEAYDVVQRARPCISINPGFLRQLELFQRMQNNPDVMGDTSAHAELRTMIARQQRLKTAIFQLFNVSTHRVGLLVADEATLLFRTVAVGAAKVFGGAGSTAKEFPQLAYFENLTKTLYGEVETLSYEDFAHKCQVTADIDAFMAQWTHASHIA